MFPDGICRVTDSYYTKTVQFQDINYQLNQNEDKTAIFDGWCDFLNYFDSSVRFQLSFVNMSANKDNYARYITISPQGDDFDSIRLEYTQMLQNQLARGNNGLIKTKYLTFGVEAVGLKAAKPRLERIETDILNNFKRLGVAAEPMNGTERLRLLHGMLHMDEQEPFRFSWDWLAPSGLSVKDFIAPSSFEFRTGRSFGVGRRIGCASFLQILAPELNDRMLADFLDMESSLIVSMHVQSVDQVKAIKTIKRKITDLQKMTIEEQKKAVRAGYDMDIIPSDLATYGTEAKKLLQDLQSRNERMFLLTFIVVNTAGSRQQLDNNVFQAASIAQKYNCQLRGRCQRVLHKRRRRSGGNDMGEAGILLTLVAGIGAAVVFQNLLRLRDNDEFPADELLTNELKSAVALVTGKPGFRKANYNFFYRKILCQLINGSFLLTGMRFYGKGFLRRFLRLAVLTDLCLIEQAHLVFAQNIGLFLAGLAEAGSLRIGKELIHVLQFLLQLRVFLLQCFYRLGQRADELRNFRGSICDFPVCCGHEFSSQNGFYLPLLYHKGR